MRYNSPTVRACKYRKSVVSSVSNNTKYFVLVRIRTINVETVKEGIVSRRTTIQLV